jgi:hypothetical protein
VKNAISVFYHSHNYSTALANPSGAFLRRIVAYLVRAQWSCQQRDKGGPSQAPPAVEIYVRSSAASRRADEWLEQWRFVPKTVVSVCKKSARKETTYSITSSARASSVGGMSRLSALAVLMLITRL